MEIDRVRPSFHIGQSRPWRGDGTSQMPPQSACTPHLIVQASRSRAAQKCLGAGATCSRLPYIHLGDGPGQTGEQRWKENPFPTPIGPPTRKAMCQAANRRGPASLPDKAHTRQTLFSVRPRLGRKNPTA